MLMSCVYSWLLQPSKTFWILRLRFLTKDFGQRHLKSRENIEISNVQFIEPHYLHRKFFFTLSIDNVRDHVGPYSFYSNFTNEFEYKILHWVLIFSFLSSQTTFFVSSFVFWVFKELFKSLHIFELRLFIKVKSDFHRLKWCKKGTRLKKR